jgi:Homing endonuclease associated repeat/HNH endonuclease
MDRFELKLRRKNIPNEELLADIRNVAILNPSESPTRNLYATQGQFAPSLIEKRFGTWNNALQLAGYGVNNRLNIPQEDLFENLAKVWTKLGRQPFRTDLAKRDGHSDISPGVYEKRFGSWNNSLLAFVNSIDGKGDVTNEHQSELDVTNTSTNKQGTRSINWRLRAMVLIRDNCICKMCGASPAKNSDVVLHVDHIVPWSKGGRTFSENLQTLCSVCNIGKSDILI